MGTYCYETTGKNDHDSHGFSELGKDRRKNSNFYDSGLKLYYFCTTESEMVQEKAGHKKIP